MRHGQGDEGFLPGGEGAVFHDLTVPVEKLVAHALLKLPDVAEAFQFVFAEVVLFFHDGF